MKVTYLSGGVGGARLLLGLMHHAGADQLRAIVNTGDDFVHWGLHVSPDLDTVMYTLAGRSDFARGWGLRDETFGALSLVRAYGGEDWFQLGDHDLGTHLMRSQWLRQGVSLTEVTARLCAGLGVDVPLLPMSDAPLQTTIDTDDGRSLPFQQWFVRERCAPGVRAVRVVPTATDRACQPTPQVLSALRWADVVVIGPSNPFVSIDPILGLPGVAEALAGKACVGVSPIVHGRAVKGPLAEMLRALTGRPPSAAAVAAHYPGLAGMVVERGDGAGIPVPVHATDSIMRTPEDAQRLGHELLHFAEGLL